MRGSGRRVALCGLLAAVGMVVLALGGWTGLGTYICPMLAGVLLLPARQEFGAKYALVLWLAMGLLALFLVPDLEEGLMFLCFFGWYPTVRPGLQKLPRGLRWPVKLVLFNAVVVALEALLMLVLVPEDLGWGLLLVLLALGNAVFIAYDILLPRMEQLYLQRLHPLFKEK